MSEYEDYLIREATEGPSFQEVHGDLCEPEPVEPNDSTETGDEKGENEWEKMSPTERDHYIGIIPPDN